MKLSIAMMVKNEEKNLEETLKSIKAINEKLNVEIIIVDTGSTDNTVEIAKRYTNNVFFHQWMDDFAQMRNISLSYCTGDWVLVLDADEVIEDPEEIVRLFTSKKIDKYNTVTVQIKNFTDSSKTNSSLGNIYRLFKRDSALKYIGIIHERPICKNPILNSNIILNHKGYISDDYELMEYKFKRNTNLLLKFIEENGDDIYTYFQLSQSYFLAQKEKEGLVYINKAVNMIGNNDKLFKKYLFVFATYYKELYSVKEYDKCIQICKKVMNVDKNVLDTYYLLSVCYFNKGNYQEAIRYGEKYFEVRKSKENNNFNVDINLEEFSLDREEEIIEVVSVSYVKLEKYINSYNLIKSKDIDIKKDAILQTYCTSIIMLDKIEDLKILLKDNDSENIYDFIINSINNKILKIDIDAKNETLKKYLNIDNVIDIYLKIVEMRQAEDIEKLSINFNIYSQWKADILTELINKDKEYIKFLYDLDYNAIRKYIFKLTMDYSCIKILLEYSKDKILTTNLSELMVLDHIEEMLIQSSRIIGENFKSLVNRRLINKYRLINKIYTEEVLEIDKYKSILSKEEKFWYKLRDIINDKEYDLVNVIRNLKSHVKEYNSYKEVYEVIQSEIENISNDKNLAEEKQEALTLVNELVNLGELSSAKNMINELSMIVGNSSEIYNVEGVINYIEGNMYGALDKLLNGYIVNSKNKDIIYNINEILLQIGRGNDLIEI
ncbi:glycosyltransferase [Clostridium sp. MB05]|uniref:glycosyltransferase n=1 Tax=Clostridium sp. MB05 TaxID=3376682 RepID=UPI0039820227